MGSFNHACAFQPLQVTTHGCFGGIQQIIQIVHSDDLVGYQIILDTLSPLRWNERFIHFCAMLRCRMKEIELLLS